MIQSASSQRTVIQSSSNQSTAIEDEQGQGQLEAGSSQSTAIKAALKKSTNSNLRDAMDEGTLDEQIHDASTQDRAVVNDVVPTEVITINGSKQDDDEYDSLQTASYLSLSRQ
eukprot:5168231-Ditylum_brightwellii.AAC.1